MFRIGRGPVGKPSPLSSQARVSYVQLKSPGSSVLSRRDVGRSLAPVVSFIRAHSLLADVQPGPVSVEEDGSTSNVSSTDIKHCSRKRISRLSTILCRKAVES